MSLKKMLDLTGRKAIITGGSHGLGLQMASGLGEMGAEILLVARKQDQLDAAVARLTDEGVKATAISADVGQPDDIRRLAAEALGRLGHCDILINDAAFVTSAPSAEHTLEQWNRSFDVNVTGPFFLSQAIAVGSMIPRRYGRILNIASPAGYRGSGKHFRPTPAYNVSKGALIQLTRVLAAEWGPHGITVNTIAPGLFPTQEINPRFESLRAHQAATAPIATVGGDEDMKGAAALFCSDAGKHITGQLLTVDGGLTVVI